MKPQTQNEQYHTNVKRAIHKFPNKWYQSQPLDLTVGEVKQNNVMSFEQVMVQIKCMPKRNERLDGTLFEGKIIRCSLKVSK